MLTAIVSLFMAQDAQLTPLKDGYVLVQTPKYRFEIPAQWSVGKESPWGARDMSPKSGAGKLGAMTAGPTSATWAELYKTSLFYIQREEPGKASPFREGKTKKGYACMMFEVANDKGFVNRHYVLLKDDSGRALALSVRLPDPAAAKPLLRDFQRMVDTAELLGPK